jgi:rhomboid protease GluP
MTAPKDPPERTTLLERIRSAPATTVFIALNVVVFLVAERFGSTQSGATLLTFGASERHHVWSGEWYRLVTPVFLHIGWLHLVWNAVMGFDWCASFEPAIGWRRFVPLYLLSGVGGVAASVIGHAAISAGASGALFGVVGGILMLRYRLLGNAKAFARDPLVRSIAMSLALWVGVGFYALRAEPGRGGSLFRMDHFAHLGGFLVGAAFVAVVSEHKRRRAFAAVFAVAFVGLLLAAVRPAYTPRGSEADESAAWAAEYLAGTRITRNVARGRRFAALACKGGSELGCALTQMSPDDVARAQEGERGP